MGKGGVNLELRWACAVQCAAFLCRLIRLHLPNLSNWISMEIAPLLNTLKDLQERTDVLRGYL